MGKGVGDLSIKASCRLLVKTYSIEDCERYISSITLSQSSQSTIKVQNVGEYEDHDLYFCATVNSNNSTWNWGIGVSDNINNYESSTNMSKVILNAFTSTKGLYTNYNGVITDYRDNGRLNANTDYLFEMYISSNSITGVITQISNNNKLYERTISATILPYLQLNIWGDIRVNFSNVKLKKA